jgi:hypothetical protein
MSDTTVVNDAAKDAAALVASLYKGDTDSASLLLGFYSKPEEMAALSSSLAAIACACLKTIDNVRGHVLISDGVMLPSGDDVLKTVMMKLAAVVTFDLEPEQEDSTA